MVQINLQSNRNGRVRYFDFLRGLAILMVVGIHTYPGNMRMNGFSEETAYIIIRSFFNCAVPLFLAISGYFIGKKDFSTWGKCKSFWIKQIPIVYIPCLVFSFPWLVLNWRLHDYSIYSLPLLIAKFFGCGYSVYYFILLIIECYLLTPFLTKYNNTYTLFIFTCISVLSESFVDCMCVEMKVNMPLVVIGSLPIMGLFFFLGIFLSKRSRTYSLSLPIGMIIVGMIGGVLQEFWIMKTYNLIYDGQNALFYIFDIGFILLCLSKSIEKSFRINITTRLVLYIGDLSFGIYLMHVYTLLIYDQLFPSIRHQWMFSCIVVVALTVFFIVTIKRCLPQFSQKYLGFR